MYGKPAIILLVSFEIILLCLQIQTSDLVDVLVSEKNYFHKINSQLHMLTNKIFSTFNLGLQFSKCTKIQGLLSMHNDLINTAKKHNDIYDHVQIITNVKEKGITELDKMFEDIINEEIKNLKNANNLNSENSAPKCNKTVILVIESLVNELLSKVSRLSVTDIVKVSNKTRDIKINMYDKFSTSQLESREIKVWRPLLDEDLTTNNKTRRIYKGKKTRIKKYPFMVSIHVMNQFMCAGSIISKDLVITAATCLQIANSSNENPLSIFVRVGSDYTNRHGEVISVTNIFFHPNYDPVTLNNNIAIVKIAKRVKFSKKRKIQRINYDRNEDAMDNDNTVTILGWGVKGSNREYSETHKLSVAHLDIYDFDDCQEIYSQRYVTDRTFCAGFMSKGGGACNRDVGGPCMISGVLIGIISFGPVICGMTDAPTVFTKLGFYANWIDIIVKQKTQMRFTKRNKTASLKSPRAYLIPLTTQDPPQLESAKSDFKMGTTELTYPDEIIILREILQEIALSNNTVIDYIIYGNNENDTKNTVATTKTTNSFYPPQENISIHQKGRELQPENMQIMTEVDNIDAGYSSGSYEETEMAVKILESLVGYTSLREKYTTAKRFTVTSNNYLERRTTTAKIAVAQNIGMPNSNDDQQNNPSDSSSYYEEGGMSIEETKSIVTNPTTTQQYFDKATKKRNTLKKIKLENYKNVIVNINPLKESRSISTNNKKQDRNLLNSVKNRVRFVKSDENKYSIRENDESNDDITVNPSEQPLGRTMAISDEDFEYEDKKMVNREYDKNMRSKDDVGSVLWRFRSKD